MPYQTKRAYCHDDGFPRFPPFAAPDERGRMVPARRPAAPTRPATPVDLNAWWEDATPEQAVKLAAEGYLVRRVEWTASDVLGDMPMPPNWCVRASRQIVHGVYECIAYPQAQLTPTLLRTEAALEAGIERTRQIVLKELAAGEAA